ncbi:alpha/beta hydrolase [Specibacter cremeus]|uniref:alpha/beta hydrolase n=1 Tax=Specibacter cremeus TaxID=1629051 RepID=UPI001F0B9A90|nr:alpha/beta hydrolase-fold protein [Specibacter cremeus]
MVLALVSLAFLLLRRRWHWWVYCVVTGAVAAGLAALCGWLVIHAWYWWPEDLPFDVIVWAGVAFWGILLAVGTFVYRPSWFRRLLAPVAAVVIVVFGGLQINAYFGELTTVGDVVFGAPAVPKGIPPFLRKRKGPDPFERAAVAAGWTAPKGVKAHGVVRQVPIPGTLSHFHGRPGLVYLPPAYFVQHRPALPVLVLVTGQPGYPGNWLDSAHLPAALDSFAAEHGGLAPIVVMPDPNGSETGNTMCMDTRLGHADTYLSKDVPNWIKSTLDVDTNPRHWAFGGFSFGATCAVQMVTRHPDIYPTFVALAPEAEPALTVNRQITIDHAFGGNTAAFEAQVPLTLMAEHRYPEAQGWFAAGQEDAVFTHNAKVLRAAAQKAGMHTEMTSFPGNHSWLMVTSALPSLLGFLAKPLGLVAR